MSGNPSAARSRLEIPTLLAGVMIGALITAGVAPLVGSDRPAGRGSSTDFLSGPEAGGTGGDAVLGGEGSEGVPGAVGGAESVPGAGPTGVGAGEPGSATGSGGSGSVGGAPGTAGSAGGGGAGGSGGSPGAGGAGPAGTRTATDVGVTADTIRIGAATLNCKGCAAFGVDLNEQPNRIYAQAYVADINARGGINGRKVEVFTQDYDPVEDGVNGGGTERRACLELTENKKVFAVVQGVIATNACFYDEHKTPLLTFTEIYAEDPETFNREEGRLWVLEASTGRKLLDFARQLDRQKLITKSTKWGLVDREDTHPAVRKYMLAELKKRGLTPSHVSVMPADPSAAQVKIAQEVPAMRGAGVTHVALVSSFTGSQFWVREASRNGWKPQYLTSDFPNNMDDLAGGSIAQGGDFTGAIAVSSVLHVTTLEQLRAEPAAKRCLDTYTKHSRKQPVNVNEAGRILQYCNTIRAFELAARTAGVNLTRQSFIRGMASVGPFSLANALQGRGSFGGAYPFGRAKWSATDIGQRSVWASPCPRAGDKDNGCWVPQGSPYRMAA